MRSTKLLLGTDDGLLFLTASSQRWEIVKGPALGQVSCLTVDPIRPERMIVGTWGNGVFSSDNGGEDFEPVFRGIPHPWITALAADPTQEGLLYTGTEPSAVYASQDYGHTWVPCADLLDLPSSGTWSFPPRPDTHHVRWIESDGHTPGRLWVAVEAGALITSHDGGASWLDRRPGSPYDTHELASHARAPDLLWSAAGDGFFESDDAGVHWHKAEAGLSHRYCWSIAIDSGDEPAAVLSSAPSPMHAHTTRHAASALYRRDNGQWERCDGAMKHEGVRARVLAADPAESGVFFAAGDDGIHRSVDAGRTWSRIDPGNGVGRVHALRALGTAD